jgi:hypothetical protein
LVQALGKNILWFKDIKGKKTPHQSRGDLPQGPEQQLLEQVQTMSRPRCPCCAYSKLDIQNLWSFSMRFSVKLTQDFKGRILATSSLFGLIGGLL